MDYHHARTRQACPRRIIVATDYRYTGALLIIDSHKRKILLSWPPVLWASEMRHFWEEWSPAPPSSVNEDEARGFIYRERLEVVMPILLTFSHFC